MPSLENTLENIENTHILVRAYNAHLNSLNDIQNPTNKQISDKNRAKNMLKLLQEKEFALKKQYTRMYFQLYGYMSETLISVSRVRAN